MEMKLGTPMVWGGGDDGWLDIVEKWLWLKGYIYIYI